jgi:type III restriction enzyme
MLKGAGSFWPPISTDNFYPNFLIMLNDGRVLALEYKGADRWSNDDSKEKHAIGELWAEKGGGDCLFIMPKGKDFDAIKGIIQ